jgi:periplasmic divalent cation tolerance protein
MTDVRVVLVTAPDEPEAAGLATSVVEAGLAACANLVGPIRSIYRWDGAVQDDAEWLLIFKTSADLVERLTHAVRSQHSYDCPEVISLAVESGNPDYLAWVVGQTR